MPAMTGWEIDLIVVRDVSHTSGERAALTREVERGVLLRVRRGVYVLKALYEVLALEQRHIVQMRALDAVSPRPVVFSHFSAAVLHGLPVLPNRLARVHTTVEEAADRGGDGVSGHVFPLTEEEVVDVGPLRATSIGRTVVDVAGAAPPGEGLMAADAVLRSGLPRELLEQAIDLAGPRQADRRIATVVAVAHPGAESASESMSRWNMIRIGYAPPELQHELWDANGWVATLDFFFPLFGPLGVGGESDGLKKFLDPVMAPQGAGRAVYREKRREDRALPLLSGLARWGWPEAVSAPRLRTTLGAFGVQPASPRATTADYAAAARDARPRLFVPRRSLRPAVADAAERSGATEAQPRNCAGGAPG